MVKEYKLIHGIDHPLTNTCQEANLDSATICSDITAPSSNYTMLFSTCSDKLPTVQSISHQNFTYQDLITVSGTGFSNTQCENRVLIGSAECAVTSSSNNELKCLLGPNSGLKPYTVHSIEVGVNNYGFALKVIIWNIFDNKLTRFKLTDFIILYQQESSSFEMQFIPKIDSVEPAIGSNAGGTRITITGDGFSPENTLIIIGTSSYHQGNNYQSVFW